MSGPRSSSLYNSIPQPAGTPYTPYDPPLGFMGTLENASIGMGRGMTNRLRGLLETAQHPGNALRGLLDVAMTPPEQLGPQILNALAQNFQQATSGPLGLGQALGESTTMRGLLGVNALTQPGLLREMTAYHGSPHDFDKFDSSKIGTGEGAQMYGHGLYFAESPEVAESYRTYLTSGQKLPDTFGGKRPSAPNEQEALSLLQKAQYNQAIAKAYAKRDLDREIAKRPNDPEWRAISEEFTQKVMNAIDQYDGRRDNTGRLFTVDIPDDAVARMLDWDAPLSQQPEAVRNAWGKISAQVRKEYPNFPDDPTGQNIYMAVAGNVGSSAQKAASEKLAALGIPGIRYLDAGSRGAGTGTRNVVVFDDKLVKVLKKE